MMATPRHIIYTLTDTRFEGISEVQRSAIGNEIVNTIQDRTASGIDKDGNRFTPYNPNYINSKHFKNAGKSGNVNLVFSNEMMNSLEYLPELSQGSSITVGFPNGTDVNSRAQFVIEGHGRKGDFTQPPRNPMGLTGNERNRIVDMVPRRGVSGAVFLALTAGFLSSIF